MRRQAPPKLTDVQDTVRRLLDARFYYETDHAQLRMNQLGVSGAEVRQVLREGSRDPGRDEFDWSEEDWKYAIHGRTWNGEKHLRVIFTIKALPPLPNEYAVIITVVRIEG